MQFDASSSEKHSKDIQYACVREFVSHLFYIPVRNGKLWLLSVNQRINPPRFMGQKQQKDCEINTDPYYTTFDLQHIS